MRRLPFLDISPRLIFSYLSVTAFDSPATSPSRPVVLWKFPPFLSHGYSVTSIVLLLQGPNHSALSKSRGPVLEQFHSPLTQRLENDYDNKAYCMQLSCCTLHIFCRFVFSFPMSLTRTTSSFASFLHSQAVWQRCHDACLGVLHCSSGGASHPIFPLPQSSLFISVIVAYCCKAYPGAHSQPYEPHSPKKLYTPPNSAFFVSEHVIPRWGESGLLKIWFRHS